MENRQNPMKQHTLFYGVHTTEAYNTSFGMWDKIKEKYPDAELISAMGGIHFMDFYKDNPERLAWKSRIDEMMNKPGIIHHGRLSKEELQKVMTAVWHMGVSNPFYRDKLYDRLRVPKDGCVPVTMNLAALSETVKDQELRLKGIFMTTK